MPEDWRTSLISPLYKKGERDVIDNYNYREISLLSTAAYKIYAMVLDDRIKTEIERKMVLPDMQADFRKGRRTVDNIYILQHVAEKAIEEKEGKLFAFFIDLKAAFDRVERSRLWEAMKKAGISEGLVERTQEIYTETKSKVRIKDETSEEF